MSNTPCSTESQHQKMFKYCDILKTHDGKQAVQEAIKQRDKQCLNALMALEHECHATSRSAIRCFRVAIRTDEQSKEITKMLDNMYEKSFAAKYLYPFFQTLPLWIRLGSIIYDETSDVRLAVDYHKLSSSSDEHTWSPDFNESCFSQNLRSTHSLPNFTICDNNAMKDGVLPVHTSDYSFAKWYITFSVSIMMVMNGPLTLRTFNWKKNRHFKGYKIFSTNLAHAFSFVVASLLSPAFVIWELLKLIKLKWKICTEEKDDIKTKLIERFWDSQLEFGMYEAIEAAEASSQLLLQMWLLSSKFDCYYVEGFWPVIRRSFDGAIFLFLEGTSTEDKALGKILFSFISIIISALSMYKRTKREAVDAIRSPFLIISVLSQVFVHIVCLLPLYYVERNPMSLVLPILIHYIFVFILKVLFDPSYYLANGSNQMIAVINVIGSILINVNVTPRKGYKNINFESKTKMDETISYDQTDEEADDTDDEEILHHTPSTFFLQTMFFILKLIENVTVCVVVLSSCAFLLNESRFQTLKRNIGLILSVGTALTWTTHVLYYRLYGHPWKYSNGPSGGKWYFKCHLYKSGKRISIGNDRKQHSSLESGNDLSN